MVFVERISHITAQVEYGLIPADPKLRRYEEKGTLTGNEGMELLSPPVFEDTARGTFFFAERRPVVPANNTGESKEGGNEGTAEKKKNEQEKLKRKGKKSQDVGDDEGKDNQETIAPPTIPTLLDQLVTLRVLRIIPNVRCRSIEHRGACLVRVLLEDSEASVSNTNAN
jgi:hypothetical protein